MNSERRNFLAGAAVGGVALASSFAAPVAGAEPGSTDPAKKPAPAGMTPDEALRLLREGNEAYLRGEYRSELSNAQRRLEIAKGQTPFAAYVTCSDSRVPPELLFGRGLGELFIIRNAGNTVDTVALGSIEYAVAVLKVPLVVVMGHERCGAVDAATKVVTDNATFPGQIGRMIEPIIPAVLSARNEEGDLLENSVRANVRRVANQLRQQTDPIMMDPLSAGSLKVVGAYYDLDSGKVDFFDQA